MSEKPTSEESNAWQRRLASQANNRAWALTEAVSRSTEEDEEMLDAAHAAMFFWKKVGNSKNVAHAAQLLAHVYAKLNQQNAAERYLSKSAPVFHGAQAEAWEVALSHAVAANVACTAGNDVAHRENYEKAVSLVAALPDPEDRSVLEATLRVLPVPQG